MMNNMDNFATCIKAPGYSMKSLLKVAMAALGLSLSAQAEDFTLTYQKVEPEIHQINEARYRRFFASPIPPKSLKKKPVFRSKQPLFVSLQIGSLSWVAAFDESGGTGKNYDLLWVDANRNGNLADERPYAKPREQMGIVSQIVRLKAPQGAAAQFYDLHVAWWSDNRWQKGVAARENWQGLASNIGVWTGKIKVGARALAARLTDFDNDGSYGSGGSPDAPSQKAESPSKSKAIDSKVIARDHITIDWNNNGRFDASESIPVGKRLAIGAHVYALSAARNGSRLSVTTIESKSGILACDASQFRLHLNSPEGMLTVVGLPRNDAAVKGIKVPVGTYFIDTWVVSLTAQDKKVWQALGGPNSNTELRKLTVEEDKELSVNLVSPLVDHLRVRKNNGEVYFEQVLRNGSGEPTHLLPAGETIDIANPAQFPPSPSVLITDEKGKKIAQLHSEVRRGYYGVFHWAKAPAKGKFRARLVFGINPLNIEAAPEITFDAASVPASPF